MVKYLPTKEEQELFRTCPAYDVPYLDKPEQYVYEVMYYLLGFSWLISLLVWICKFLSQLKQYEKPKTQNEPHHTFLPRLANFRPIVVL